MKYYIRYTTLLFYVLASVIRYEHDSAKSTVKYSNDFFGGIMKVFALNGSARGNKGVTWKLLERFLHGLEEGGAQTHVIQLKDLTISYCSACLTCMHKTPGKCATKDDMDKVYPHLKEADLFVMATPLYVDNMSAQMKAAMDRCICGLEPFLRVDAADRVRHPYSWTMPAKFFLISTSGFPEAESFAPLIQTFRAQAANFGCEPVGEICIPGSIALQMAPQLLEPHLDMIQQAGKILAMRGRVEPTLLEEINRPIVTRERYLGIAEQYEAWARKSREEAK